MKIFSICISVCLLLSLSVSAQKTPDQRLIDAFGVVKVSSWQKNSPDSIAYYNFLVQSGFEVYTPEWADAQSNLDDISMFPLSKKEIDALLTDQSKFNVLLYLSYFDENKPQTYRISDTGYILVFHPLNYIRTKQKSGK